MILYPAAYPFPINISIKDCNFNHYCNILGTGEIYKCCDLEDLKRPLVIKISKNHKELKNEIVSI